MNERRKLLFLSSVAAPYQIGFCHALQDYFDAQFWFYETCERKRGKWWQLELGDHCRVLENVLFFKSGPLESKYLAPGLAAELARFDPDIVMLGGFSIPANIIAYRWARRNAKKTIVFTERSRNIATGKLRNRGLIWALLHWIYRDVDMVMTSAEDAVPQFRDELGFGDKVVAGRYAADLDAYFHHPSRHAKSAYTYLFANRMTEIYNPLRAIEIFAAVLARHPGSRLLMNAAGEMAQRCRDEIAKRSIGASVEFLTEIKSWTDLGDIYARSDMLILPANFSNGNFTILEAMASGMGIVISNRILGVGKMVEDGINGFACEPAAEAFLERIERYIHDPGLFARHAETNRAKAAPFSAKGTAAFFAGIVRDRLSA